MWALLSTRLRTWLLLAIALPVARSIVHRLAVAAEERNPRGTASTVMRHADAALAATSRRRGGRREH
jgi:hypothetical protein